MIDIGRGDQENFEKKNCGQSPQKIADKSATPDSPDENVQKSPFSLGNAKK